MEAEPVFLKGKDQKCKLTFKEKVEITHDSYLFTFTFDPDKVLGVRTGNHLYIHGHDHDGQPKDHKYTTISDPATKGTTEILIKVYRPCPQFPKGGALTQQLEALKPGETIDVSGPCGKWEYRGRGVFNMAGKERTFTKLSFLAGGSGITPFLAIMRGIMRDPEDKTEVTLIFSNKTGADMLMHEEFIEYLSAGRLKYVYCLTREQHDVEAAILSHINEEMVRENIPPPASDHLVFYCGPKGFNATALGILEKLGHADENALKY